MDYNFIAGDIVNLEYGDLTILKPLGKGKSGYSFLAEMKGKDVVLKIMHNEPAPYYSFSKNKVLLETNAFELLNQLDIAIPKLLHWDADENYLIKDYIPGKTGAEWIIEKGKSESIIQQLFKMSNILISHKINIDYFPTNFVVDTDKLYYIDYEVNNYDSAWNLVNWGIYYWANREGFKKFMKEGDASAINLDVNRGQPIREPFINQVEEWIRKYAGQEF